ncbi:hypothetical protein H6775_03865 [Candidatus Nomurabacteria bacterium]|nr:hypothetical protein [Candidatus Nomurabacteria bacterium]
MYHISTHFEADGTAFYIGYLPEWGDVSLSACGATWKECIDELEKEKRKTIQYFLERNLPIPKLDLIPFDLTNYASLGKVNDDIKTTA